MSIPRLNKHDEDFPHQGGCQGCRDESLCNVCGHDLKSGSAVAFGRCTNGRCSRCHAAVCTPGGATAPGHGYGDPTAANLASVELDELANQHGDASIVDNRDGSTETVTGRHRTVQTARSTAFGMADRECKLRNRREGWTRFVPLVKAVR